MGLWGLELSKFGGVLLWGVRVFRALEDRICRVQGFRICGFWGLGGRALLVEGKILLALELELQAFPAWGLSSRFEAEALWL